MYKMACLGVQESLDTLQTNSGVKDMIALYWFDQLIAKSHELKKNQISNTNTWDIWLQDLKMKGPEQEKVKYEIKLAIQSELMAWIITQPSESYKKLPMDSGELTFCVVKFCVYDSYYLPASGMERITCWRSFWFPSSRWWYPFLCPNNRKILKL